MFGMRWGPDLGMVLIVFGAWAAFCASAGLLLGSLARTEGQATGLGVLWHGQCPGCTWRMLVAD